MQGQINKTVQKGSYEKKVLRDKKNIVS